MQSLQEFIQNLRRYKKNDIIKVGLSTIYDTFSNKKNYSNETFQLISGYGPRLIIFGLATANDFRNSELS